MYEINDRASSAAAMVLLLAFTVAVLIWLAVLALAGWWLFRWIRKRMDQPALPSGQAVVRLFDAPPTSSWLDAYDQWLAKLENLTGIDFNRSPRRLMAGALIISIGAALVIGICLLVVTPAPPVIGLGVPVAIAAAVGGVIGQRLGQPAGGWFVLNAGGGGGVGFSDSSSFVLGEEVQEGW